MNLQEAGWIALIISAGVIAFSVSRLARRLERTADALDSLLHTTRHQLEITAEQARGTMKQIEATGSTVDNQVRKMEKMVMVTESVMESIKLTSVIIQRAIASPIAGLSGVVAGVAKGIGTLAIKRTKGERA